jgi:hypothetical protein
MNRKLLAVAVVAAGLGAGLPEASAASITVTAVIQAPPDYHGKCPAPLGFEGRVFVGGAVDAKHPLKIAYHFTRSDGTAGPSGYIDADHPGEYKVQDVWKAGTALQTYKFYDSISIAAAGRPWPAGPPSSYGQKAGVIVKCLKLAS